MLKTFLGLVFAVGIVHSQVVNHVRLVNHEAYLVEVLGQAVRILEDREWCNFKLPDHVENFNETIFEERIEGTVTYSHGFVVTIERIDIVQSTVQQVWSWNSTDATGAVTVRGTLRMHDVQIGYDVDADLTDHRQRYTATYVHPLISFAFSIIRNTHTEQITVAVIGTVTRSTTNRVAYMPTNNMTDVFASMFDPAISNPGILLWASEKFEPVTQDVVNQVPFPTICYNCPV